jgi:NAD(P)-dependent dehydrogenase (short-subunit alcohol dehydrogenase family)
MTTTGLRLKPLDEQVILITGASSGIGLVTARMAATAGAAVVAVARNEAALRDLVEEIRSRGGRAAHVVADVGRQEDVERAAAAAVEAFGRVDTWVNNAGISIFGPLVDVPMADWHRMFDTVYWGMVYGSLAAAHHFDARGGPGAIVNVGSFFGDQATPVQSSYSSAKFAVHGFTDALRMELEHDHQPVSVTLVHPGRIDTPYNEHAGNHMPMQPIHRGMVYPPEAVAEAILWSAAHPKRDMYVGSQAKLAALLGMFAPRLTDRIMERIMYTSHQARERVSSGPRSRALFEAGYGGHERGTHEPAWLRSSSLYVKATKRPALTAAVAAAAVGAGIVAGAALVGSRGSRPGTDAVGRAARAAKHRPRARRDALWPTP